jgi:hypothetical protein
MYLQQLKNLYKNETDENKKIDIKNLIIKKIIESREQWYKQNNIISYKPDDLFTRMLAEVEGLQNINLNKIEKPFDTTDYSCNKKQLGIRKDI